MINDYGPVTNTIHFHLEDDTPVELSAITPEDRERLRDGFALVSPASRYLRFFSALSYLSDSQLRYLTELDQHNHVAWGAISLEDTDHPGLGIGRFIRTEPDSPTAEIALTVIDDFQRRGIGTALFGVLYLEAMRVGVKTLRAFVLPANQFLADLLIQLGGRSEYDDDAVRIDLPVVATIDDLPDSATGIRFKPVLETLQLAHSA